MAGSAAVLHDIHRILSLLKIPTGLRKAGDFCGPAYSHGHGDATERGRDGDIPPALRLDRLSLDRRRVVHFAVTPNPTQDWLSRQMTEAFPWDTTPGYLLRDRTNRMVRLSAIAFERWASRKSSPRHDLRGRTRTLSVSSVRSAVNVWITSSSSTSAICAASYRAIFNTIMTPERIFRSTRIVHGPRPTQSPSSGNIIAFPEVGGLHHRYERRAA